MGKKNGLKLLYNGVPPTLVRHASTALGLLVVGTFTGTLLYADVQATEKKVDENRRRVETIEGKINEMTAQQRVLIERMESESKWNAEFRDKTSRTLERILERLPSRAPPR